MKRLLPCENIPGCMNTFDIISIKPKLSHLYNRSFSNDVKKTVIDVYYCSSGCVVCLPSITRSYTILFCCKILGISIYICQLYK